MTGLAQEVPEKAYDWVVASRSPKKVGPFVRYVASRGWNDQIVVDCDASSAGPEQPHFSIDHRKVSTQDKIGRCCLNRLLHSKALRPLARRGWIAFESGVIRISDNDHEDRDEVDSHHDMDLCILYLETVDGRRTVHLSQGVEMPTGAMEASARSHYTVTAGRFIAEMLSTPDHLVDHADWHAAVTMNANGAIELTRSDALFEAVRVLFARHERKLLEAKAVAAWHERMNLR